MDVLSNRARRSLAGLFVLCAIAIVIIVLRHWSGSDPLTLPAVGSDEKGSPYLSLADSKPLTTIPVARETLGLRQSAVFGLPPRSGKKREPNGQSSSRVDIRLSGNASFSDREILQTLELPESPHRRHLKRAIERHIRAFYRDRGFARVSLKASVSTSDPHVVDVRIQEHRVYYFGGVQVGGTEAIAAGQVASLYPSRGGPVDWRQLRLADLQLRREYRERGFLDVKVNPRSTVLPSTQVLSYRVSVIEGHQYRVGSVSIPKGLLTQFPLQSGDVFAPGLLAEFVRESGISEAGVLVARNPEQALVQITISQ